MNRYPRHRPLIPDGALLATLGIILAVAIVYVAAWWAWR